MSKRPTPETDAVRAYEGNWDTKALRMTAHARKLERERDEARKMLVRSNHFLQQSEENLKSIYKERDEAREVVRNIVRAGRVGRQWQNYAIEFLEKLEETK